MNSDNWVSRQSVAKLLPTWSLEDSLPIAERLLADDHRSVRQSVIKFLGGREEATCLELLKIALGDEYHYCRQLAFHALLRIYRPEFFPPMAKAMQRPDATMKHRMNLIYPFKDIGDRSFTPILAGWLRELKKHPKETFYFSAIANAVESLADPELIPAVLELAATRGVKPSSHSKIMEMLGALQAEQGIDYILSCAGYRFGENHWSDSNCLDALVRIGAAEVYLRRLKK